MTISCSDVVSALSEHLRRVGYQIHNGDADTGVTVDDESGKHWWFSWSNPDGSADVEVGPTCNNELEAEASAMDHFFENAKIPMEN